MAGRVFRLIVNGILKAARRQVEMLVTSAW